MLEGSRIRVIQDLLPGNALLTLALLEQEMLATIALVGKLAASGALQTLLGAAVGLELGHVDAEGTEEIGRCKGSGG